MSKGLKIFLVTISLVLVLLISAVGVYFFWPWHRDFFNNADAEFDIPGLDEDFCPQGMTELEGYNKYIVSGYMSDGGPSRYYVIDAETNNIEKYFILNINDKKYDGHAGGIASFNSKLWTVSMVEDEGEGYAFSFNATDVINVDNGGEVLVRGFFKTNNNADCVFVQDNLLWVGEFYRPEKFETDTNHHLTTRSGETNRAICYAYEIEENAKTGVVSTGRILSGGASEVQPPVKALSVRDLCQGVAVTKDGKFVVSTSYSIFDSNIYYYKDVLNEDAHSTIRVGLDEIPLWFLDNDALIGSAQVPAMSEELFVKNDRVYLLFESACKKYKFFNRVRIKSVYSFALSYLEQ